MARDINTFTFDQILQGLMRDPEEPPGQYSDREVVNWQVKLMKRLSDEGLAEREAVCMWLFGTLREMGLTEPVISVEKRARIFLAADLLIFLFEHKNEMIESYSRLANRYYDDMTHDDWTKVAEGFAVVSFYQDEEGDEPC